MLSGRHKHFSVLFTGTWFFKTFKCPYVGMRVKYCRCTGPINIFIVTSDYNFICGKNFYTNVIKQKLKSCCWVRLHVRTLEMWTTCNDFYTGEIFVHSNFVLIVDVPLWHRNSRKNTLTVSHNVNFLSVLS